MEGKKNNSWLLVVILLIVVCLCLFSFFIIRDVNDKENIKQNSAKEKSRNLERIMIFDKIEEINFGDNVFIGVNGDMRYYLMDFNNNILDQSDKKIIYDRYGYYYKTENNKLLKDKEEVEKVLSDTLVNIYANEDKNGTNYFFKPLDGVGSLYNEQSNFFVAYKYDFDTKRTQISKYDLKTGQVIVSKTFDGEIKRIENTLLFRFGETNFQPNVISNEDYLSLDCIDNKKCNNSIIDLKTMERISSNDYNVMSYFVDKNYNIVSCNGKWGVIDNNGSIIIPIEYDYLESDNKDNLLIAIKNKKKGVINLKNDIILEFDDYEDVVIYGEYVGVVFNDKVIKIFKNKEEIFKYENKNYLNSDIKIELHNMLALGVGMIPFDDYYFLNVFSYNNGETSYSIDDSKLFLIYKKEYLEFNEGLGIKIEVITDKINKDKKYVIANVPDENKMYVYDEKLNLLFSTVGTDFERVEQINNDYILLEQYNQPNLYLDMKYKMVENVMRNDSYYLYGVNNLLNDKYIVKFDNNTLYIYDEKEKLQENIKNIKNIYHIKDNNYILETITNKYQFVQLEFD